MDILIVAATQLEIEGIKKTLIDEAETIDENCYIFLGNTVHFLTTHIGSMVTSFALVHFLSKRSFALVINIGICGSYRKDFELGTVVEVTADRLGDLGVCHADGKFEDIFEIGLEDANRFPFENGVIYAQHFLGSILNNLPKCHGLTLNTGSGEQKAIDAIIKKYSPDIETMEGLGFFYTCRMLDLPCVSIRAISNYVAPRDREAWKMEISLDNLAKVVTQLLKDLSADFYFNSK